MSKKDSIIKHQRANGVSSINLSILIVPMDVCHPTSMHQLITSCINSLDNGCTSILPNVILYPNINTNLQNH
jgi:hypothetical protein